MEFSCRVTSADALSVAYVIGRYRYVLWISCRSIRQSTNSWTIGVCLQQRASLSPMRQTKFGNFSRGARSTVALTANCGRNSDSSRSFVPTRTFFPLDALQRCNAEHWNQLPHERKPNLVRGTGRTCINCVNWKSSAHRKGNPRCSAGQTGRVKSNVASKHGSSRCQRTQLL